MGTSGGVEYTAAGAVRQRHRGASGSTSAGPRAGGVLLAHPKTQHSYQAALALQEAGVLRRYVTGFYYKKSGTLSRLVTMLPSSGRIRVQRELMRRRLDELDDSLVTAVPVGDMVTIASERFFPPSRVGYELFLLRLAQFQRRVAAMVRRLRPRVVVAYDSCALRIFEAAREVGAMCVLDQTIGHVTQLREAYRAAGIESDESEEFVRDALAEVRAADLVVTSSQYVLDGLVAVGVPESRVVVIPYGVDLERFRPAPARPRRGAGMRALFVGRIAKRKGVPYILEAVDRLRLPDLELTLVGGVIGDALNGPLPTGVVHRPGVPHHEVHTAYQEADVFIQMSLHESSAMTVFEALASGLPVITTPNSGSVVRDGVDGFVVPAGDVEALMDRIMVLYRDPQLRGAMARRARERAESFSWERYRERFGGLLADLAGADPAERSRTVALHQERMEALLRGGAEGGAAHPAVSAPVTATEARSSA